MSSPLSLARCGEAVRGPTTAPVTALARLAWQLRAVPSAPTQPRPRAYPTMRLRGDDQGFYGAVQVSLRCPLAQPTCRSIVLFQRRTCDPGPVEPRHGRLLRFEAPSRRTSTHRRALTCERWIVL